MAHMTDWKRHFFPAWIGQAFSLLGSNLVSFALVWWLTEQTGSATVLAMGTLIAMVPNILLGPFTGALVDRWNRKTVMIVSDSLTALFTLALAAIFAFGEVQVWHIYVLNFLRSLGGAFQWPAMQSSTSLMVPEKQLTRINGINQALRGALQVASPPLGAVLMSIIPIDRVLMVDVITAVLAVSPLLFVRVPQPEKKEATSTASLMGDIKEAVNYIRNWKALLHLVFSATAINFVVTPAFVLAPLLITNRFGGGAMELAWLESAFGIGLMAGGLLMGVWGGFKRKLVTIVLGTAGMGAGLLVLASAPGTALWIGLVGLGFMGLMNPICNSPIFAIMQSSVEPSIQGRVFMIFGSVCDLATPLAMIIAGPVADKVGVDIWYWVAGIGTLAVTAFVSADRTVWHLEEEAQMRQEALAEAEALVNTPEPAKA